MTTPKVKFDATMLCVIEELIPMVKDAFPGEITSSEILDAIVNTSKVNQENVKWTLAIFMSGRPIEPLDNPDIAYQLLWKGNWLCSTWDLALLHTVFVAKKADGLTNEFFFKKALDSVPSWNKYYRSVISICATFYRYENFYDFLINGKKSLLLCV